jgi:hypothetical protein
MLGTCAFCEVIGDLKRSHIIPEFFYGYDDLHRLLVVKGDAKKPKLEQKGWREHLLCWNCEQLFNDRFEKPMKRMWLDSSALPERLTSDRVEVSWLEYSAFKLFHLSVLWRAAKAKGPMFRSVSLGTHEREVKRMLQEGDAGTPRRFQVIAAAIRLPSDNTVAHGIVMAPFRCRVGGHTVYCTFFGGCAWYYVVSSHALPAAIQACALNDTGRMMLPVEDARDLAGFAQVWETYDAARRTRKWDDPWRRLGKHA